MPQGRRSLNCVHLGRRHCWLLSWYPCSLHTLQREPRFSWKVTRYLELFPFSSYCSSCLEQSRCFEQHLSWDHEVTALSMLRKTRSTWMPFGIWSHSSSPGRFTAWSKQTSVPLSAGFCIICCQMLVLNNNEESFAEHTLVSFLGF